MSLIRNIKLIKFRKLENNSQQNFILIQLHGLYLNEIGHSKMGIFTKENLILFYYKRSSCNKALSIADLNSLENRVFNARASPTLTAS